MKQLLFLFMFVSITEIWAKTGSGASALSDDKRKDSHSWTASPFEYKVFIENKGQFDEKNKFNSLPVLYSSQNQGDATYFMPTGLIYTLSQTGVPEAANEKIISEKEKEASESRNTEEDKREYMKGLSVDKKTQIYMEWIGGNPNAKIITSDLSSEYFNYYLEENKKEIHHANAFHKLRYKDIYPGIDVEYVFHEKEGMKYTIYLQPGSDVSKVRMKYIGADSIFIDNKGNLHLATALGDIIDHAPLTYTSEGLIQQTITSTFRLMGNEISFNIAPYNRSQILVIDPWVTNPSFPSVNKGLEVETDGMGNIYVYGASGFSVRKYNPAGVAQWTYSGIAGTWGGDLIVDKAGNCYTNACAETIHKISTTGALLWLNSNNSAPNSFQEVFSFALNASQTNLIGVGANNAPQAGNVNITTGDISGITNVGNNASTDEVRWVTLGPDGNYYGLSVRPANSAITGRLVAFTPLFVNIYDVPSCHNKPGWNSSLSYWPKYGVGYSGENPIAVSCQYIYTYDGYKLCKYNISNGISLASTNVSGGEEGKCSGIVLDSCGNVYVGTKSEIRKFDQNLNFVTSVSTPGEVYDLVLTPNNEIGVSGNTFVGIYSGLVQCQPGQLVVSNITVNNATCGKSNGVISVSVTGGNSPYSYSWSNGATTTSNTGLAAGTYTLTIMDASCIVPKTQTTIVAVTSSPMLLASNQSSNVLCNGGNDGTATALSSGGTFPYTYLWSSGGSNAIATGLLSGTYTCIIADANGCDTTQTVTITEPPLLTATATYIPATCASNDGNATITASGGCLPYTYSWNTTPTQTTATATGLWTGNYTCTITDTNGCSASQTVNITNTSNPNGILSQTNILCNGQCTGTAAIAAAGGNPPYTYFWSNGQITSGASNLCPGTFSIIITDANGCTETQTVLITEPTALTSTVSPTNPNCNGGTGLATVSVAGGSPAYAYSWSPIGQTTFAATGLPAGEYTVTVTDANGCTGTQTVSLTQPTALTVTATSTEATCGNSNGTSAVTAAGGTPFYMYSWNPTGQTTAIATGLTSATYTVTISDSKGCTQTQTVGVTEIPGPNATANAIPVVISLGDSMQLMATGGGTYQWSPSNGLSCTTCGNPTATPLQNTTYCVLVTDANSCTDIACISISVENLCGKLFLPNAFSPNNDGENDKFQMHVRNINCVKTFQLIIYNRWGEKVFETNNIAEGWDGKYEGREINTCVFVYYLKIELTDGSQVNKKGNISLIR